MDIPKQLQDKLVQFQNIQNQLQLIAMQKQQLILQKTDIENSRKELEKTVEGKIYRMVGPLLIETKRDDSLKQLEEDSGVNATKIKVLEKQEKKLVEKFNELRSELQSMIPGGGTGKTG
jgi:prefoldin beta subunit